MAILVALFIVVPIVELYVIIQIGSLIGVWPTIALLLADALLGSLLLRHQGRGAWRRFNAALAERRFPGREVADGLLIAVGGTLLLTPGFVTDIVGVDLPDPADPGDRQAPACAATSAAASWSSASAARRSCQGRARRPQPTTTTRRPRRSRPTAPQPCPTTVERRAERHRRRNQLLGCLGGWWMSTFLTVTVGVKPS